MINPLRFIFVFAALFSSALVFLAQANGTPSDSKPRAVATYSRIITLAPVLSEWTAEILGQAESEKKLLAVSEYSLYPAYLKKIPTIGSYAVLNVEAIARLKPDLIIASSEYNRPEQLDQLKRLHLPIEILPGEKFAAMPDWIRALAHLLHSESAGKSLAKRWEIEVKTLASKKAKTVRFFLEIQHQPLITIGGTSFLNDAFAVIGYENIFHSLSQAYPKVSKESVLKENPDLMLIMDLSGAPSETFKTAEGDWKKYGKTSKMISDDEFARCSFVLLKALGKL
jgi:ABC-type hemin transport system substrate-binding protein